MRRAYVVASGTAVSQIILLAALPILGRLYDETDFGTLGVFLSVVTLAYVIGSGRYERAINLPKDDADAGTVLILAFLVGAGFAAFLAVVLAVGGGALFEWTGTQGLYDIRWLIPLAVLFAVTYQALGFWVVRQASFRRYAAGQIANSAGGVGVQIAFGAGGLALGLVLGAASAFLFGTIVLGWQLVRSRQVSRPSWTALKKSIQRYRRFPLFGVPSGLLNRLALELPVILLAGIYGSGGAAVAGWFILARRLVSSPAHLVSNAASQVYLNEAAQLANADPERIAPLYRRTWHKMLLLSLVPTAVLALVAPAVFAFLMGESYREAGVYARILCPMVVTMVMVTPLTGTFAVLESQHLQLLREGVRVLLVVGAFVSVVLLDLDARIAVALYGLAMMAGYLLLLWLGQREVDSAARRAAHPEGDCDREPTHGS